MAGPDFLPELRGRIDRGIDADGSSAGLEGPEPSASGRYRLQAPDGFQSEGMPLC